MNKKEEEGEKEGKGKNREERLMFFLQGTSNMLLQQLLPFECPPPPPKPAQ